MKKFKLNLFNVLGFILFTIGTLNSQNLPSGFVFQQLATIDFPVAMAWAPDGRLFLLAQEGDVKIFKGGQLVTSNFVTLDSVYSQKEKGLLGVAFDPNFEINKYVYFYYTCDMTGTSVNGTPLIGTPVRNKIVRYTVNGDKAIVSSKKTILNLDIIPSYLVNYNHDGGTMHFGQDGKLYVATGENTLWCPSECISSLNVTECSCPNDGINHFADNENGWSQDLFNFHGKILRLNSDGSAPSDNPFYNNTTTSAFQKKYIYARGVRNPFTMHFRPGTNDIYFNDVGSGEASAREEINKLSPTSIKNFAYPVGEGIINNVKYTDPIFTYSHRLIGGNSSVPAGTTTAGCAITGGVFYQSVVGQNLPWPSKYHNKYFYMDFCDAWINTLDVDNGNIRENFARGLVGNLSNNSGGGWGSICLESGPDGNMYLLSRSQTTGVSGLYRISYQPTTVSGISINTSSNTISIAGGTLQMTSILTPNNTSINTTEWYVSPTNLASISNSGLLKALANGVVTVTGRPTGNLNVNSRFVITITNQDVISSISLSPTSGSINVDKGSLQFTATFNPSNAVNQNVLWYVVRGTANVLATIDGTGKLSSYGGNGTVTVMGVSEANNTKTATAVVTITNQIIFPTEIILSANEYSISVSGGTLQINADIHPIQSTNSSLNWSLIPSSGVASISGSGLLKALNNGVVTVVATSVANSSITGMIVIQVSGNCASVSSLTVNSNTNLIGSNDGSISFTNVQVPSGCAKTVQWSILSTTGFATATINSTTGLLTNTNGGDGTITVKCTIVSQPTISNTRTITISGVIVDPTGVQLQSSGNTISMPNGTMQFTADDLPANAFDYGFGFFWQLQSVVGQNVASISGTGLLQALNNGTVRVVVVSGFDNSFTDNKTITISGQNTSNLKKLNINGDKVMLYPNPNNGEFKIKLSEIIGNISVEVTNREGKQMYFHDYGNSNLEQNVNISHLARGIYRVSIIGKDGSYHFMVSIL